MVVVYGVGLVGLMVVYFVQICGVFCVFVVDCVLDCFKVVEKMGWIVIDFIKGDLVDVIIKVNGEMVDRLVDVVGYQVCDSSGLFEQLNFVFESMIKVIRVCGGLGI